MSELALAWRLARRELRGGLQGFAVFLACLTLGVGRDRGGGGDQCRRGRRGKTRRRGAARRRRPPRGQQSADRRGRAGWADAARRRAAPTPCAPTRWRPGAEGRRVVVSLKAVDGAYPLYGAVEPGAVARPRPTALADGGAVVEPGVLQPSGRRHRRADPDRRGDFHGARRDRPRAGPARRLRQHRAARHDRPGRSGAHRGHPARLARPLRLPLRAARRHATPRPLVAELRRGHPDARWRARGTRDVQPQVARFTDRLASYLTMAALTTLLIGGIGVALAIQNYLAGKTATIATLKCLGARSRLIFRDLPAPGAGAGRDRHRCSGWRSGSLAPWLLPGAGCAAVADPDGASVFIRCRC